MDWKRFRAEVARHVRGHRGKRDWSQTELARRWGRSRDSVVRLEKGEKDADLDMLASLAEAFGLSLAEFLWPIIAPDEAEAEVQRARQRWSEDLTRQLEELRQRYLKALDEPTGQALLYVLMRLTASATPDQATLLVAMLQGAMRRLVPLIDVPPDADLDAATLQVAKEGMISDVMLRGHVPKQH
jgi:DNA-binding XRE family transcriptional regulator